MEYTFKLFIADEFENHDIREYTVMAEDIDIAYEKVMNMFYAVRNEGEVIYKVICNK